MRLRSIFRRTPAPEGGALAAALRARVSPHAEVISSEDRLDLYTRAHLRRTGPTLVLRPASAQDVAAGVSWAYAEGVPIVARGLSTTAHGEALPALGGLLLDMAALNHIDAPDREARTIRVGAGATWGDLEARLAGSGLALATYPASRFSTVGGWVSTGGLGINSFGYGHLRRWVAALEVAVAPEDAAGAGALRTFTPRDKRFAAFFGAEGGMGVVTAVTLRLRPAPEIAHAHLFYFDISAEQVAFVQHLVECGAQVAHVKLYDRRYMAYLNRLYEERHAGRTPFYQERPAVLVHIDTKAQRRALEDALACAESLVEEAPDYAARALWQGRFYPLALKRYGPDLLTAPVVVPLAETAAFVEEAMRLGEQFGLAPAAEATIAHAGDGGEQGRYEALVMPYFPCESEHARRLYALMIHHLTRAAIRRGGRPYAIGIMNQPFAREKFGAARQGGRDRWRVMQAHKRAADRAGLFNPRPRAFFRELGLRLALGLVGAFPAQAGQMARMSSARKARRQPERSASRGAPQRTPPRPRSTPLTDAELAATINACTGCGNCVAVCPAYLITHDETTTGRAKLQTGWRVLQGEGVGKARADSTFLCTYCKACQDVCEVELPLLAAYATIEERLAAQHGRPDALIAGFIARVETSDEYAHAVGLPPPAGRARAAPLRAQSEGNAQTDLPIVPSRRDPVGPFSVVRSEHCINCGHCAHVCPTDVHNRQADDPRLMAQPTSHQCVGCFQCVQACPTHALTLASSALYAGLGQGVYTPEIVLSLSRQAETGRAPADDGGGGLAALRLDINPPAHPAGRAITTVALGRRLERLTFSASGEVSAVLPPTLELAAPFVFALPEGTPGAVADAVARVARESGLLALVDGDGWRVEWGGCTPWLAPRLAAEDVFTAIEGWAGARLAVVQGLETVIARLRTRHPTLMLAAEVACDRHAAEAALALVRAGADVVILTGAEGAQPHEGTAHPADLLRQLLAVHEALVKASRRERVSLLARGGVATAHDAVKLMLLGADAVVIDWPLLLALECRLQGTCAQGAHVCGLLQVEVDWAAQRLANLVAAWRAQLVRAMAGLGIRHAQRLRGERGRVIFEADALSALGGLRRVADPARDGVQILGG